MSYVGSQKRAEEMSVGGIVRGGICPGGMSGSGQWNGMEWNGMACNSVAASASGTGVRFATRIDLKLFVLEQ